MPEIVRERPQPDETFQEELEVAILSNKVVDFEAYLACYKSHTSSPEPDSNNSGKIVPFPNMEGAKAYIVSAYRRSLFAMGSYYLNDSDLLGMIKRNLQCLSGRRPDEIVIVKNDALCFLTDFLREE